MSMQFPGTEIKSISARSQWATWLFIILIITYLFSIASAVMQLDLLSRAASGLPLSNAEAEGNDNREAAVGIIQVIINIAVIIAFLIWIHRAYSNAITIGRIKPRFTPGWAVGWFFVPIMSLFKPYQAMDDIWKSSLPGKSSELVGWWWALFLISNFGGNIYMRLTLGAKDFASLQASTVASVITDCLDIIGAAVALSLIHRVSRAQEDVPVDMNNEQSLPVSGTVI
jgi:hypothetical protein